jgi:hypothetical protein
MISALGDRQTDYFGLGKPSVAEEAIDEFDEARLVCG